MGNNVLLSAMRNQNMKLIVKRALRAMGISGSRNSQSPYEYLLDVPRFKETTVKLLGEPFRIADSVSFYWSHREIFLKKIYKFNAPTSSPLIVDCGANYGASVVYFKSLYPESKILAVEPDPVIFEMLKWNVTRRGFRDVTLLNKAISIETKPMKFFHEGADGGRLHLLEDAKTTFEVDPIKLDELVECSVDFLKMDIEGAETEAICSSERLENVSQMFIEYHSFIDSDQTLGLLLQKLSSCGFRYYIHTQFCSRRPLLEEKQQLGMDLQLNMFAKKNN